MTPLNSMPSKPTPNSSKPFGMVGIENPYFKKNFSLHKPSYTENKRSYVKNLKPQINPANLKLNSAQTMQADEYIHKNYRSLVEKGDIGKIIKSEKNKIEKMRINLNSRKEVEHAEKRLDYFKNKFGIK
ncbi:MAG: hypothetical protein UR22_C0009G0006 [Parcubacteria group bacterium GW2011_GWC2_32_10]|nr:MAG: hypothetical protein UR22_C0009G0006 [Parcubacteria group bacterium GW2011_GWC2_32_10]